jgi:steroid 5-alpha reductase family enzyme
MKTSIHRIQKLEKYPIDIWNHFITLKREDEISKVMNKLMDIIQTTPASFFTTLSTIVVSNKSSKLTFMVMGSLALAGSSLGYYSFLYFVTIGYASAILFVTVAALLASGLSHNPVNIWDKVPCFLVVMWAVRLIVFSLDREFVNWPEWHKKIMDVDRQISIQTKILAWLTYSPLYAAMTMPCVLRLQMSMKGLAAQSWGLFTGIALQVVGLLLESVADYQKASFKMIEGNRKKWCNRGLYQFFLYPNYLAEGIFWIGTFTGSMSCFHSFFEWGISVVGLIFILSILRQAMSSLGEKHMKKYGHDETFRKFRLLHSY